MSRILFVHNALTRFVATDLAILQEQHTVEELAVLKKTSINPFATWKAVKRNEIIFAWFASWHSLLPVYFAALQKKPAVLVCGGYDTANVPAASYGNQRSWWKRIITNFIIRKSTGIICNSDFAKKEIIAVAKVDENKIMRIYHGIDSSVIRIPTKLIIALTIGNVFEENLLRKGIEPFLAAGNLLKSYQFIQAGAWKDKSIDKLRKYESTNVQIRGYVGERELQSSYAVSRVYVQPSLHEAFGMSVVEAMMMGCIPVVSPHGALPEVVGNYGIVLKDTSPESIVTGIKQSESFIFNPEQIRQYVSDRYSMKKRREGLLNYISGLCDGKEKTVKVIIKKELSPQTH
jgi:glycosyltransferase involved in cell wall biosynthesis